MRRLWLAIACLAAVPATALRSSPSSALIKSRGQALRSRALVAQYAAQDLPVGWTTVADQASGQRYYYHEQSGLSQWELPQQDNHAQQISHPQQDYALQPVAQGLPVPWSVRTDEQTGDTYYVNEHTGHSQWEPPQTGGRQQTRQAIWRLDSALGWTPRFAGTYKLGAGEEAVLGRYDMHADVCTRPWVSRKQCAVIVEADGTAILVTRGKPATGWRAPSGEWSWLWTGFANTEYGYPEYHILSDGDQISLDANDCEGSIFTASLVR